MGQTKQVEAYLQSLENRLMQPEVRNSETELDELIADDFIEFGSSGRIYDKSLIIDTLKNSEEYKNSMIDFYVQELSKEISLVTYGAVRENSDGVKYYSLRSSIWRLRNGKWQIVFHQGTALSD